MKGDSAPIGWARLGPKGQAILPRSLARASNMAALYRPRIELPVRRRIRKRQVPHDAKLRYHLQRSLFGLAPDHNRRTRRPHRLRLTAGSSQFVEDPGEGSELVAEPAVDDLDAFFESVEALCDRAERNAEGLGFWFEPPSTKAEMKAATRDDVERGRHVGRDREVTEVHSVHHAGRRSVASPRAASMVQLSRIEPSIGSVSG